MLDWDAAFRTWLRRARDFGARPRDGPTRDASEDRRHDREAWEATWR